MSEGWRRGGQVGRQVGVGRRRTRRSGQSFLRGRTEEGREGGSEGKRRQRGQRKNDCPEEEGRKRGEEEEKAKKVGVQVREERHAARREDEREEREEARKTMKRAVNKEGGRGPDAARGPIPGGLWACPANGGAASQPAARLYLAAVLRPGASSANGGWVLEYADAAWEGMERGGRQADRQAGRHSQREEKEEREKCSRSPLQLVSLPSSTHPAPQ